MRIQQKIILLLVLSTVLPLSLLGYFAVNHYYEMEDHALEHLEEAKNLAMNDSIAALNDIGKREIRGEAEIVAKLLEDHIRANPEKTLAEFRNDTCFKEMTVLPVGETGYTLVGDYDSLVILFHKYPEYVGYDANNFKELNPSLWELVSKVEGGHASEGYHDFEDPDGTIRKKYSYMMPVPVRTADGVGLFVASTTYLDEFNKPILETKDKLNERAEHFREEIYISSEEFKTVAFMIVFGIVIVSSLISIMFAKKICAPIYELSECADKIRKGNLDKKCEVRTGDELQDLAKSFDDMRIGLKDRNDLFNSLLNTFKGKFGNIAVILVRKNIQKAIKKNPRIEALLPKNLRITVKRSKKAEKYKGVEGVVSFFEKGGKKK